MREPAASGELWLVGTVHLDVDAAPTLIALLERLAPAAVTVEISRYSVEFRQRMEGAWLDRLDGLVQGRPRLARHYRTALLRRQLSMPFEWQAATAYARRHSIPCLAVDWGEPSRQELPRWMAELITGENLELLCSEPDLEMEEYLEGHRRRARRAFSSLGGRAPSPLSPFWQQREKILTKRVDAILKRFERVAHIGGWTHMLPHADGSLASALLPVIKAIFLVTPNEVIRYPLGR